MPFTLNRIKTVDAGHFSWILKASRHEHYMQMHVDMRDNRSHVDNCRVARSTCCKWFYPFSTVEKCFRVMKDSCVLSFFNMKKLLIIVYKVCELLSQIIRWKSWFFVVVVISCSNKYFASIILPYTLDWL